MPQFYVVEQIEYLKFISVRKMDNHYLNSSKITASLELVTSVE